MASLVAVDGSMLMVATRESLNPSGFRSFLQFIDVSDIRNLLLLSNNIAATYATEIVISGIKIKGNTAYVATSKGIGGAGGRRAENNKY